MADKPVIFISYSHKDEPDKFLQPGEIQWLTYVRSFLDPAAAHGQVELWDDRQIEGGGDWKADIDQALKRCAVCVFLVSRHSLSSRFILDVEMKRMLEQHHARGAHLYPILITSTDLGVAPWLLKLNLKPTNATALELYEVGPRNKVMSELAAEIRRIIERAAVSPTDVSAPDANSDRSNVPDVIEYSRLPETPYEGLVGREAELRWLDDAWASETTNIVSLIAEGGVGKSALVNRWLVRLQEEKYRGAQVVLGWSFFSQGTERRATSSDAFLNWALEILGIGIEAASASTKVEQIANAMRERQVLIVLDGVEPLQHGPGPEQGRLKDQGLREFLRRFAAMSFAKGHSLIVLTSRLAVTDISKWRDGSAPVKELDLLSDGAGGALLTSNGVVGAKAELEAASREAGGHALTLTLMAGLLRDLHGGDVRRRDNLNGLLSDPTATGAARAARMMESYETEWLSGLPLLQALMHIVGLFDRPASKDCLDALRRPPAIGGLTDAHVGTDDAAWLHAIARLREVRLLSPQDRSAPHALDAHPLVREWFGARLKDTNEKAWREAHGRLYEHLRDTTEEGGNPKLEDLAPLYQAVAHGCRAARFSEALHQIYMTRICRMKQTSYYSVNVLGAFGSDLAALSWFFETPYSLVVPDLSEDDKSWVLGQAGSFLRTQGRIDEALQALEAGLQLVEVNGQWSNFLNGMFSYASAQLMMGYINDAILSTNRLLEVAPKTGEVFSLVISLTVRARALFAAGRFKEAKADFLSAERRWREKLTSFQGAEFCEIFLADHYWKAAEDRATKIIEQAQIASSVRDVAVGKCVLGRARLGLFLRYPIQSKLSAASQSPKALLDDCITLFRAGGISFQISQGHLARAGLRRGIGDWDGAARDLDEVEEIAEPGPMRLFLCDMALERARLAFAKIEAFAPLNGMLEQDNPPKPEVPGAAEIATLRDEADKQLKIAADYVETCGYHRRDEELAELQAVLRGERRFAELPPRV